jgi:hypothetical protein
VQAAQKLALLLDQVVGYRPTRPDGETLTSVLEAAAGFATRVLGPLGPVGDRVGCRIVAGRVSMPPGYREAWAAYSGEGWAGVTAPEAAGGQALPMALASAVQILLDRSDVAFGMLAINARCATRLLAQHAGNAAASAWMAPLSRGQAAATICISEPQAGSDVGRIRTRARPMPDGTARISGEKCWISFGDHDLTDDIVHVLLARDEGAPAGTQGLSLYLVPRRLHGGRSENGIKVLRIEEKLGLHASPTCGLGFEDAVGYPIGPAGRGLPTLFAMIVAMRVGVAAQGAALALAAAEIAEGYARERGQGGDPKGPPTPIIAHADVRRLLLAGHVRAEVAVLLALEAAAAVDAADAGDARAHAAAQVLLPIAKTVCSEAAFAAADTGIQILGGAGVVKDWPLERMLRDCRVFSIYEGTTAMQGLDLLQRRVLGKEGPAALEALLSELPAAAGLVTTLGAVIGHLAVAPRRRQEAAAVPFLGLAGLAIGSGLLNRAAERAGPLADRYRALAETHDDDARHRAALLAAECMSDALDRRFDDVFR